MALTYEPIATTTLGTASNSLTFSSIPSTYTDLRLVGVVRGNNNNTTYVNLRYNGDTAANYSATKIDGNGSVVTSQRDTGANWLLIDRDGVPNSNATAGIYGMFTVDIFSYAGSTFKTNLATVSSDRNGSGYAVAQVGLWRSTSAITSIGISANYGNPTGPLFTAGSTFTLYGIKAA